MRRKQTSILLILFLLISNTLIACNIPVFRYALERWRPDELELVVVHKGGFSQGELDTWFSENGTDANIKTVLIDSRSDDIADKYKRLSKRLSKNLTSLESPIASLQGEHLRGEFTVWSGPLESFKSAQLLSSPARNKIGDRLMAGHAVVWLIIESSRAVENEKLEQLLATNMQELEQKIELPEGIGLPGSELFANVPLLLKFTSLSISRNDEAEAFLLNLAEGFQPEAFANDSPLVIPIFGRGRALEVIPASQLSAALIRDLTMFLCGACSCQVKDQNPGFDLLFDRNWEKELYGEDGDRPPSAKSISPEQRQSPVLLQIPPGRNSP